MFEKLRTKKHLKKIIAAYNADIKQWVAKKRKMNGNQLCETACDDVLELLRTRRDSYEERLMSL